MAGCTVDEGILIVASFAGTAGARKDPVMGGIAGETTSAGGGAGEATGVAGRT